MSATVELQDVPALDTDLYDIDVLHDPYGNHEALQETALVVGIQDTHKHGDFRIPGKLVEVAPPSTFRCARPFSRCGHR